jgi:hypothetical protein
LDIKTILTAVAVALSCSGVTLLLAQRLKLSVGGTTQWAWGGLLVAGGLALICLRGAIPDLASIWLANSAIICGSGFFYVGMRRFAGLPPSWWPFAAVTAAASGLLAWFTYVHPSLPLRVVVGAYTTGAFFAAAAWALLAGSGARQRPARRLTAFVFAAFAGVSLLRPAMELAQPVTSQLLQAGPATAIFYLLSLAFVFCGTAGILAMVGEQLQSELRTLRGIVPICSHCKNVRDDDGFWRSVEEYLATRSEADFSHGICPECLASRYPELNSPGAE